VQRRVRQRVREERLEGGRIERTTRLRTPFFDSLAEIRSRDATFFSFF
jgi:hypothetical protein